MANYFKEEMIKDIIKMTKTKAPIYKIYCSVPIIGVYSVNIREMTFLLDYETFKEHTYETHEETLEAVWKRLIDPNEKTFNLDILGTLCYLNREYQEISISENEDTETLDQIDIRCRKNKVELLN